MKKLLIANKGLLEIEALTLLGASTKRGDKSKIGKFGSGNKYALAYLLRTGCNVNIYSGNQDIILSLVRKTFREHPFDIIAVNGKETSITTEFGHEWNLWQALRELYTNAIDEGLVYFGLIDTENIPDEVLSVFNDNSITRILIDSTPEIEDFIFNKRDYIADGNEILFECSAGKIYRKHNNKTCIYYRGIRCFETSKESLYDYDLNDATLNEDRLLAYSWTLPQEMWKMLFVCNTPVLLRGLLSGIQDKKYIENEIDMDFVSIYGEVNQESWKESLDGNMICPRDLSGYVKDEDRPKTLFLPNRLYNQLISVFGKEIKNTSFSVSSTGKPYRRIEILDNLQTQMMKEVNHFLDQCGFIIPYSQVIVDFDDINQLGGINEEDEILISCKAFEKGNHQIVHILIHEFIHIKWKCSDATREFEINLADELITYMKVRNSYTL